MGEAKRWKKMKKGRKKCNGRRGKVEGREKSRKEEKSAMGEDKRWKKKMKKGRKKRSGRRGMKKWRKK